MAKADQILLDNERKQEKQVPEAAMIQEAKRTTEQSEGAPQGGEENHLENLLVSLHLLPTTEKASEAQIFLMREVYRRLENLSAQAKRSDCRVRKQFGINDQEKIRNEHHAQYDPNQHFVGQEMRSQRPMRTRDHFVAQAKVTMIPEKISQIESLEDLVRDNKNYFFTQINNHLSFIKPCLRNFAVSQAFFIYANVFSTSKSHISCVSV